MKLLAGIFFAALNAIYASLFGGTIDGTAWEVKVKQDGFFHWATHRETLVFHGGKAIIAGEIAKGYSPSIYETKEEGGGTIFTSVLTGEGHNTVEWTGRIEGEHINGIVIVRGNDGRDMRYVFSGEKKAG